MEYAKIHPSKTGTGPVYNAAGKRVTLQDALKITVHFCKGSTGYPIATAKRSNSLPQCLFLKKLAVLFKQ